MRYLNVWLVIVLFVPFSLALPVSWAAPLDRKTAAVPLVFEPNRGQAPVAYQFLSHNGALESLFSKEGIDLLLPSREKNRPTQVHLRFVGGRPDATPDGLERLSSVSNYLVGNDPSRWIHDVPNYSRVVYRELYPGVDLIFHGADHQMEHDFHIAAHTDPNVVRFSIEGSRETHLDDAGNLEISLGTGTLVFQRPVAYQETAEEGRDSVDSAFVLESDGSIRFRLGAYDPERELVIDPVFRFSTYLAGNTADYVAAVTTDSVGNVYLTGYTYSSDFPVVNGTQPTYTGSPDAYVSKLDATGKTLLYSTFLGGTSRNYGNAIALDGSGNIVVSGTSSSNDFPHVGSVPSLTCEGNNDCFFVASLTPDGSAFNYAGLIGGIEGTDVQTGSSGSGVLAVDATGNAYLAGVTDDPNFEITPGTLTNTIPGYPYNSTFVLKVDSKGGLSFSTIIPGTLPLSSSSLVNVFIPNGIFVTGSGEATIAGTAGPGLPSTVGVIQPTFPNNLGAGNSTAGFVLQLNATASAITYATYVTGTDSIGGLAVDAQGNSYVTGGTSETNLPVSSNAYQKKMKSGPECTCNSGFILKLNSTGTSVLAATYLSGTPILGNEGTAFTGIALDGNSNVFVGGMTASTDFPLQSPFTSLPVYGESDMILAEMKPDLSALLFASFLSSTDQIFSASQFAAITVDHQNNLVVVGETSATDFPTTPGSFQRVPPSQANHDFVAKLNMAVAAPSFCPDSWSLVFGNVPANQSSTQIVHLKNCGNSPLHIRSIISSATTVTTKQSCGPISPAATCPISVIFTPSDSSPVRGGLTFRDNTVISPQVIVFSGQGIAPTLSPSSGSVGFGHLLVNTKGVSNALFFENSGNAPLKISAVSVDGNFSITQDSCQGTLQPDALCLVYVTFSPTAVGIRTGTLTIVSNDPVSPQAGISLNGFGDAVYAAPVAASLDSPTAQIKNGRITVQVSGANFYPASVIEVNGKPQVTKYSSGEQLQATLDSALTNTIGEISISVFNPTPGGGTSVALPFTLYAVVDVDAAFLTTVPGSDLLYASVPSSAPVKANTVISINPVTGGLGAPIPVGSNPSLLASSSDGKYLFVVSDQDQTVQRINLATRKVERTFPFPPNSTTCCGSLAGADLKGIPGSPLEVVLALDIPLYGFGEMALYNDAGLVNYVPTSSEATLSFSSFAFAGTSSTIYSLPFTSLQNPFFNIINITPQGLQYTVPGCCFGDNNATGAEVVSDNSRLYTSAGEVWNPTTQAQVGSFLVTTYNDTSYPNLFNLLVDASSGHIFVIGDESYLADSSSIVLSAYGQKSLRLSGALAFPQVPEPIVQNLVRWGSEGFAFIGQRSTLNAEGVYLLSSSLAAPVTSNPVPSIRSIAPSSVSQDAPAFQLTFNGQGFTETSVADWNGKALKTTFVSTTVVTAAVPAAKLSTRGKAAVTVTNPSPGGGKSNPVEIVISPLTPLISFSSSTLTFPPRKVGTSSPARTISVQNPGTAQLTLSGIKVTGPNAASFHETSNCGSLLAPGANCSLSIVFEPTSEGSLTASVSFSDNASGSPQVISVAGKGD